MIVKQKPTDFYIAWGSICYLRFNEENETEICYHCKAKTCNECKIPLVFKECKYTKKTKKIVMENALVEKSIKKKKKWKD